MKKLIFFALGFFMALSALASFPPPTIPASEEWRAGGNFGTCYGAGPQAVANDCRSKFISGWVANGYPSCAFVSESFTQNSSTEYLYQQSFSSCGGASQGFYVRLYTTVPASQACPSNSTASGSTCTCNTGFDESGSSCVPHTNKCTALVGKPRITNVTLGYARTRDYNDNKLVTEVPQFPSACDAGCTVNLGAVSAAWRSQEPTSQGLYRLSLDIEAVPTGAECTQGTADAGVNKTTLNPPCPGFVGEINGKTACVGTASQPLPSTTASTGGVSPAPGNPAAGEKPATGEGSGTDGAGRTPASGTGGASGGPSSAAGIANGGTNPAGTIGKPTDTTKEQANCGAPGQPKCLIDESGTPDGKNAFDGAATALDAARNTQKSAIQAADSMSGPAWSWTFSLPTGCTPLPLFRGVVLNMCPYQPMIHDLMSMVWFAATLFCITGMVGRAIREA
jgi:hypothetical protein